MRKKNRPYLAIDNALLRVSADLGVKMLGEGTEEYLQEILEPVYRNLIFDENNEIKLVSEDAAYSFLLGALTAGLLEGKSGISTGVSESDRYASYQDELRAVQQNLALAELDAEYEKNVDGLNWTGQNGIDEIFKTAGEYLKSDGTFDLEAAKADCRDYLQNIPEKNKMYLRQSLETVTYEPRALKRSPFGYVAATDTIAYNPDHPAFKDLNLQIVFIHELSHRVDGMFVQSWEDSRFSQAISEAKNIIAANPERFITYCAENDFDGFLSDIISAICEDDYRLDFYHDKTYWQNAGNKEREIFANLFSLEAFGDKEKIEFLAENFPEILKAYRAFKLLL